METFHRYYIFIQCYGSTFYWMRIRILPYGNHGSRGHSVWCCRILYAFFTDPEVNWNVDPTSGSITHFIIQLLYKFASVFLLKLADNPFEGTQYILIKWDRNPLRNLKQTLGHSEETDAYKKGYCFRSRFLSWTASRARWGVWSSLWTVTTAWPVAQTSHSSCGTPIGAPCSKPTLDMAMR